jgi:F-type H+-transporting ATPase subunit epsilon
MDRIRLAVVTGDKTVLETQVESVSLPTGFGSLGVLAGHAPMLCAVEEGILRCRGSEGSVRVRISPGLVSVEHNEVTVLVSDAQVLED